MNAAPWSLPATWAAFARGWQRFFHEPCDARVYAALRIVFASLMLIHLATLYPDLDLWFTEGGILPLENALKIASPYSGSLLAVVPGTSAVVHACFWITVAHATCLLVGLLPRLNALCLFIWIVSFQVRNDVINDGEDRLMRLMCFLMIWMPSGHCWSVNAWIRRWLSSRHAPRDAAPEADYVVPIWPLRLLQIEMAALLFSSGLVKLGGDPWLGGTALYYVSRLDDHFGRFYVPAFIFDTPWIVAIITWSVLLSELLCPLLIWFRETRLPCLLILVAFHLANEWTMNLFLFHWLMLCGWLAFVTPADFAFLFGLRRSSKFSRIPLRDELIAKTPAG
jgi:hypothetical protein